jgi:uncharacterized protein YcgI (DUF1989 family)
MEQASMANVLTGHRAVLARQVATGEAAALDVETGQLIQIIDLAGHQIASVLAFNADNHDEYLSGAETITGNGAIVLGKESQLYSTAHRPLFSLVEDTVGRHDLLTALPAGSDEEPAPVRTAIAQAAADRDIPAGALSDAVHWFKNVLIKQRGEIEEREPLAERNDFVTLKAEMDLLVIVANTPPGVRVSGGDDDRPGQILVRVYR